MLSAIFSLVLLGGFGTYALPTASGETLSIRVERNANYTASLEVALARAQLRYGNTPVPASAKDKRGLGAVDAHSLRGDLEYLSEVKIGTPEQTFMLNFDTGSSDLWVFSTATNRDQVRGQALYDPGASNTAQVQNGQTWRISYQDESSASGIVYQDSVSIGGLKVPQQMVEVAQSVSPAFTADAACSGLVGLGFDNNNAVRPNSARTWFSNFKANLAKPLFTTNLHYHDDSGTYTFGFIDTNQYQGDITYTAVDTGAGHWGWTSTGYGIGGNWVDQRIAGIADTGTSLLLLPNDIAASYYAGLQNVTTLRDQRGNIAGYEFPCNTQLPDFTFGVEGARITIPGPIMNYAQSRNQEGYCQGGIAPSGNAQAIFGDIALKTNFVVWDVGNTRLGWARQR